MIDLEQTILSQYANSPILMALVNNMNEYIDPRANLEEFYNLIWNIDTAGGDDDSTIGYGLDVWGRIVGVSRTLHVSTAGETYFGFSEYGAPAVGFHESLSQGSFFNGTPITEQIVMKNGDYRKLIYIKALANISSCSIPAINQVLKNIMTVFGYGDRAYVEITGTMEISYVVDYALTPIQEAMMQDANAMINPVGVDSTLVHL